MNIKKAVLGKLKDTPCVRSEILLFYLFDIVSQSIKTYLIHFLEYLIVLIYFINQV
jgi:hypothetical protein